MKCSLTFTLKVTKLKTIILKRDRHKSWYAKRFLFKTVEPTSVLTPEM